MPTNSSNRLVLREQGAYGAAMAEALRKVNSKSSIEMLVELTRDDMARVNAQILARTGSDVVLIPEVASHLINSGGKRLRPMLTLASAALVGASGVKANTLAAAVEFMHTATLLHDDVVDSSDMRRGSKTARMLWGNEASVLVGDFLLGQAFQMMVETESLDSLRVLSKAAAVIAEGEVLQLNAARALTVDTARYFAIIEAKTAELFAAACEVGPCLAGAEPSKREALRLYGLNLGIAFQLIDDVLDYSGDERMGKNPGDDLMEGKVTLPVILSYQSGDAGQRRFWEECFSDMPMTEKKLQRAIEILHDSGALEAAQQSANDYADKARASLSCFSESPIVEALTGVCDFCVERQF